jgi:predicted Rossmann fold flavoprotein
LTDLLSARAEKEGILTEHTDARTYAVAVVGGGAAGMAAAVSAAPDLRRSVAGNKRKYGGGDVNGGGDASGARDAVTGVLCLERNDAPGRKLLATGNGRCNLSNVACAGSDEVVRFFRELGLLTRLEANGCLYPYSGQAAAVRDALREEMSRRGVVLRCCAPVRAVRRTAPDAVRILPRGGFELETDDGARVRAARLVIATGGKAGPQYGSRGDGYAFARRFGHSVVSPLPSLVRMVCADEEAPRLRALKGVRARCAVALWIGETPAGRAAGEMQFTEDGLSGICVLDLSRYMRVKAPGAACRLVFDFAPDTEERALRELLAEKRAAFLSGVVPAKLAAQIDAEAKGGARAAARLLKRMEFSVTGTKGWKEAAVTSGGVPLGEVDADTMESKLVRGLFFAGELLDYDGPCGGFNLNHAFLTGMKAGRSAANGAADA